MITHRHVQRAKQQKKVYRRSFIFKRWKFRWNCIGRPIFLMLCVELTMFNSVAIIYRLFNKSSQLDHGIELYLFPDTTQSTTLTDSISIFTLPDTIYILPETGELFFDEQARNKAKEWLRKNTI